MEQENEKSAGMSRSAGPWNKFSPREQDIIEGLLQAQSVKDIALNLHLTVNTVKDYIKTIYQKAQVHSARALLIQFYLNRPPAQPGRSRDLADAIQRLLDSHSRAGLIDTLLSTTQACTDARQVALFDLLSAGSAAGTAAATAVGTQHWLQARAGRELFPLPSRWSEALEESGFFQLPAPHRPVLPPPFRWDFATVSGEMIGVRLSIPPAPALLLLSEPLGARFDASALPTVRILACVAERELQAAALTA